MKKTITTIISICITSLASAGGSIIYSSYGGGYDSGYVNVPSGAYASLSATSPTGTWAHASIDGPGCYEEVNTGYSNSSDYAEATCSGGYYDIYVYTGGASAYADVFVEW